MSHKFRKKPVVIDAVQFLPPFPNLRDGGPKWFGAALVNDTITATDDALLIHTREGTMRADVGDWIIRGTKGEIYPCKPDIFAEIYEPADG